MTNLLKQIFSITNSDNKKHKVINIGGLKIKLKRKNVEHIPYSKIRMIEIEIFSYCNRKCWFCPNSIIDRHSNNILMKEKIYLNILKDLRSINFSSTVSYSRYNEPLSHPEIFIKRLEQASKILPNAKLHTNTNGDFLTRKLLDDCYKAGLRSLNIQCYLNQNEPFNIDNIKMKIKKMAEQLNLKYFEDDIKSDYYGVKFIYKDMNLRMYARDFHSSGTNRGGAITTIAKKKRTKPCYIPFTDLYVDYNGFVMPCCNLRSDIKEHQNFILGDTKKESILKIFNNSKIRSLRKILKKENIELYPCNECNFALDYIYKY